MSAEYFQSIFKQLLQVEGTAWADENRVDQIKMDVGILDVFCFCIQTWNDSIDEEDIESKEVLSDVISYLQSIWPKEFTLLSSLLEQMGGSKTRLIDVCIQDFDAVMFELEGLILQSKIGARVWCEDSVNSLKMVCKPSISQQVIIIDFLQQIQNRVIISRYRDGKFVPLKKQVDSLRGKTLLFLNSMLLSDGKESNEYLNFIGQYACISACLTFMYWGKEDNNEAVSDMNDIRFYVSHMLMRYAYDVTPLYNFEEGVESFVDFFFDHLVIILKDDFLLLRDRLTFLFTFLINPPCENIVEEQGDLIRNQIHAILHQDEYLLLSFYEIDEDFSDKKELFIGFLIRIDIVNAKISQLYRGSSDSWVTVEAEKMEHNCFVPLHRELSSLEKHAEGAVMEQIQLYKTELKFVRVFLLWLVIWDDTDEEIKVKTRSIITSFRGIWGEKEEEGLLAHRLHAKSITDWHPLAFELQGNIQQSKVETEAWCVNLFHSSFQFKTSIGFKILEFLDLNDLVNRKASGIAPFKKQNESMEEKLIFLNNFLKLAVNCTCCEESEEFKMFVQAVANDASCLTFYYWAKDANSMISHMLCKIKPTTPDVARLYFGTLMAIYVQRSDCHMFGQTAFSFVKLFLEDLVTHLKDDDFQILQDNIVFLLTFLNDPLSQNVEQCNQIDVLFWEGLYCLVPFDDIQGGTCNKNMLLSEFMTKIEAINAQIICIYGKFPDSSLYNFPKVISPQFLDFLLQNLRNLKDRMNIDHNFALFAKYKIIKIEKELASLRPLFIHIFGMQTFDIQSELNEIWFEVVSVLHLTEHVIMSCISSWFVFDHPIWYHMAYLLHVFDEIKEVNTKLEKIKIENIPNSNGFIGEVVKQGRPLEINEIVVGFEDEEEKIIGMLTSGPESLDTISIVGIGGLGKTTLAKKIFGSSWMKSHFHVLAFCSVSQDHNTRSMLLDIISDVTKDDNKRRDMTKYALAHELYNCLSYKRYLIILDDIWDVGAWNELRSSFPGHENGSRVMLTTRSLKVANECKINSSPHELRSLNEVESWTLLQKKVFGNDISPEYLYQIGNEIAKNCKGLGLAIVVIGGLLARNKVSVRWWSDVARRLVDYLSEEGCMSILELSYTHLAKNLKPCLIYLAAFPEDRLIIVKHVIMLWIAEGFIQETVTKSLDDVANEYFHDLVDSSLIIVVAKSSTGGIHSFRVHDMIRELCLGKCRDGNFFQFNHKIASPSSSYPSINNHYRVSTMKESDVTVAGGSSLSNARTVLVFCEDGYHNRNDGEFSLRKFGLVQVLDSDTHVWRGNDINQLTSMIHLRYINATLQRLNRDSIPSSISNLWNIKSLMLNVHNDVHLPETFWRLKSLRHVKVPGCIVKFPDDDNLSSDQILDKVVSFSEPIISTGKDVERLLQRLPVVRKMKCDLRKSSVYDEGSIETLDFHRELQSLRLHVSKQREYMIKFPSTLKKLTLDGFLLPWTALSAIADIQCLEVLKLRQCSFVDEILETDDLVFENVVFFELFGMDLVKWNASDETFPSLEQLVVRWCRELEELPPCFEDTTTLKRIDIGLSPGIMSSAFKIQEELKGRGMELDVSDE